MRARGRCRRAGGRAAPTLAGERQEVTAVATTTARRPVARFTGGAAGRPARHARRRGAAGDPARRRRGRRRAVHGDDAHPGTRPRARPRLPGGEGVVRSPHDVVAARHCPDAARDADGEPTHNVVEVRLRRRASWCPPSRYRAVSSACGICGTTSIDAVRTHSSHAVADDPVTVAAATLAALPERLARRPARLRPHRRPARGRALHPGRRAASCSREDVGRHNAVDKVVGWAFERGLLPLRRARAPGQRAGIVRAGAEGVDGGRPVLAAVSAPSSLAVDLAVEAGLTLVGFSRGESFNVYAGAQRITR